MPENNDVSSDVSWREAEGLGLGIFFIVRVPPYSYLVDLVTDSLDGASPDCLCTEPAALAAAPRHRRPSAGPAPP